MFKRSKWLLMGLLVVMMMALTSVGFAASQDFSLVNKSGHDITGFWIVPADSDTWGDDLLKGQPVANGDKIEIVFDEADKTKLWNFSITDNSGKTWKWEKKDYDLTTISTITYTYKGEQGWVTYE